MRNLFETIRQALGPLAVPFGLAMICLLVVSCAQVPITGRSQLNLVPSQDLLRQSEQAYRQFLKKHKLCTDPSKVDMVRRVGFRIARAVERYLAQQGQSRLIRGYKWEFNLIEDKQINAWCMPGGKVVVYTGILPICRDDAGLAVVLSHEIAHAVANHAAERMSQSMLVGLGGAVVAALTGSSSPYTTRAVLDLYGLGANLAVMLPYSRMQEEEADRLGLIFMAVAGYDPRAALDFWERMSKAVRAKGRPPEFLSTHPSDETRIRKIKEFMPTALRYYERYGKRGS
jgi:predicted Zn-dependent protease